MTEIVHSTTGELLDYQPVSPMEIEFIIREIGDRLERAVVIIDTLQRARYDAEEAYSKAFEMAKLESKRHLYNDRIAEARLSCLPLLRELNEAKAQLHHAEHLQDALKSKLMGYQNINKVNGAAYGVGGVAR
ncbi:hypothetical protein IT072_03810 [Leifsonia sp. ZF2019]|uniref:hypothetical protein n=1 Tax=Leifsonia sp. ZF2019 TaxID=2781978 RepID=UPI001CBCE524|nr:hypothetical protein [Leifsonia sp. ZF2019]UAJ80184.1 hypothetical protein IT072_03810 [Leifsonia sp. ZF2019]